MQSLAMLVLTLLVALGSGPAHAATQQELTRQVFEAESTFAQTMASRDSKLFASHVALDAVFFGRASVQRGKVAVLASWQRFFEGPDAPFSWVPEQVEVLESGTLALSSGPVRDPAGNQIGTFNSIWRLEPDGHWRVVFDKGCAVCESAEKK